MEHDGTAPRVHGPVVARVHCIRIAGEDARRFAQTQFSGDLDSLAPGRWQWNAWLDANGRAAALMQLADPGDGTLLAVLRGGDPPRVQAALAKYLLRSRACLAVDARTAIAGGPVGSAILEASDAAFIIGCGERSLQLAKGPAEVDPEAADTWRLADIRAGWPTLPAGGPHFLPPALGLERLGAVSFGKGCYPGQEIAARLHYRGGHKLRLQHVRGTNPLALGPIGGPDRARPVQVLDAVFHEGLAEALIVAPGNDSTTINLLGVPYDVVSIFEP